MSNLQGSLANGFAIAELLFDKGKDYLSKTSKEASEAVNIEIRIKMLEKKRSKLLLELGEYTYKNCSISFSLIERIQKIDNELCSIRSSRENMQLAKIQNQDFRLGLKFMALEIYFCTQNSKKAKKSRKNKEILLFLCFPAFLFLLYIFFTSQQLLQINTIEGYTHRDNRCEKEKNFQSELLIHKLIRKRTLVN